MSSVGFVFHSYLHWSLLHTGFMSFIFTVFHLICPCLGFTIFPVFFQATIVYLESLTEYVLGSIMDSF